MTKVRPKLRQNRLGRHNLTGSNRSFHGGQTTLRTLSASRVRLRPIPNAETLSVLKRITPPEHWLISRSGLDTMPTPAAGKPPCLTRFCCIYVGVDAGYASRTVSQRHLQESQGPAGCWKVSRARPCVTSRFTPPDPCYLPSTYPIPSSIIKTSLSQM